MELAVASPMDELTPQTSWREAAPQRTKRPVLDLDHLRCFTAGSVEFEREVVGLFAAELPKSLAALERASSIREWHMAAHTIKGSALGIGACQLADAAREAERAATPDHPGRIGTLARVKGAASDVLAEVERLQLI